MRPNGGSRVLVVEDEPFIAMELTSALKAGGFDVLGPVDDALDLIEEFRPDAALLDVNLRGESVTPVAMELISLKVPYLIVSAFTEEELARDEFLARVPNLGKPTNLKRMVEAVRALQS
ncbi:response regulator (plasmid) [Rhizobium sp. CB3090]|uniref:response regulator n=1 Tax=Rhizobium sp. CB3090 TaxID=3039156 RepID=UPI0024B078D5|nr:response regulator [Rhizobium sp. CB3090]WFU13058.1 response regulator [Rhizobium sp. CB3090]